jgi:hypothetical protein
LDNGGGDFPGGHIAEHVRQNPKLAFAAGAAKRPEFSGAGFGNGYRAWQFNLHVLGMGVGFAAGKLSTPARPDWQPK